MMSPDEHRYAEQIEKLGLYLQSLDYEVSLMHPDDGHPAPGIRIHLEDEAAELVCVYSPLADIDGLEDLDLLNVVLSRAESLADQREAAEAVIIAANEMCPFGHFGLRSDGELYYRTEYITEYGELPEITSFADSLKLVSYADIALRPVIMSVGDGRSAAEVIEELRSE